MSKVTTKQCREFIIDMMKKDPAIILGFFCGHDYLATIKTLEENGLPLSPKFLDIKQCYEELLPIASNIKNWKRQAKYKPGHGRDWGCPPNTVWIREFYCEETDGQLAFQILEFEDGTLMLGAYVGD